MIKGVTKTGFRYSIYPSVLDDMELLELAMEVDEKPMLMPKLIEKMLGKKQKQKLYNHCRTKHGNVPSERVGEELGDIFKQHDVKK